MVYRKRVEFKSCTPSIIFYTALTDVEHRFVSTVQNYVHPLNMVYQIL